MIYEVEKKKLDINVYYLFFLKVLFWLMYDKHNMYNKYLHIIYKLIKCILLWNGVQKFLLITMCDKIVRICRLLT